jgi:hypothetical protein
MWFMPIFGRAQVRLPPQDAREKPPARLFPKGRRVVQPWKGLVGDRDA